MSKIWTSEAERQKYFARISQVPDERPIPYASDSFSEGGGDTFGHWFFRWCFPYVFLSALLIVIIKFWV